MDWYSWLSRTGLDQVLVYQYGRAFTRNELREEDASYFNHEFLQSMGISVAKHRLEILKLARKDVVERPSSLSRLVLAINKTKKLFTKNISKLASHKSLRRTALPDISPYRTQWTGALRRDESSKEEKKDRSIMRSGPLERRMQDSLMVASRALSISGPLDEKVQERLMFANQSPLEYGMQYRTPNVYGVLDRRSPSQKINHHCTSDMMGSDDGLPSLWSLMFQDMKPT